MQVRRTRRVIACLAVTLAAACSTTPETETSATAPGTATAAYDRAQIALPDECRDRMTRRGEAKSCLLRVEGGSLFRHDLVYASFTLEEFEQLSDLSREALLDDPSATMRTALELFETQASNTRTSGMGRVEIIAQSRRAVPASPEQTGLDECLYFDEDVHVLENDGRYRGRVDLSGIRCLGMDAAANKVWYTYAEIFMTRPERAESRMEGFAGYALRYLRTLRLA